MLLWVLSMWFSNVDLECGKLMMKMGMGLLVGELLCGSVGKVVVVVLSVVICIVFVCVL